MLWIVGSLLLLAALYLLVICPRMPGRGMGAMKNYDYAHRGLWNEAAPENSLPAFARAAERGFGMELDVRLTADEKLCILHDDQVERMCGARLRASEATLEQLRALRLKGTDCRIPTLREALDTVNGKTPLIIELKTGPNNALLCRKVRDELKNYTGLWCVESFDPRIMRWWKKNEPQVIRGQLAEYQQRPTPAQWLLGQLWQNALSRPDFIAWNVNERKSLSYRLMRRLFKPHLVGWTVRSEADMQRLKSEYDMLIFERFWNE